MLRIHFTSEDLCRTRLAAGPEPMWEILLSLHKLADGEGRLVFDEWRHRARAGLPAPAQWLLSLAPPVGYSPDFLTPAETTSGLRADLDTVLSTPSRRIRADLAKLRQPHKARGPWHGALTELAGGRRPALHRLERALLSYHTHALAPDWQHIETQVHADLATRRRTLRRSGVHELLAGLHPEARWQSPVLELPYSRERDLHLDGRGMRLLPSYFCWGRPFTFEDPGLPPVLAYPIEHDLGLGLGRSGRPSRHAHPDPEASLAALLGRTRTAVLTTLAADGGCTTTELARRTGVSLASASQHARVLREAGLITTVRQGTQVVHSLRPAGTTLLDAPRG